MRKKVVLWLSMVALSAWAFETGPSAKASVCGRAFLFKWQRNGACHRFFNPALQGNRYFFTTKQYRRQTR